ncbi:unnamed protein product [Somion occarium]|uniref:F-box domain-containing protein n=1 Tax=Somion occarium TaxID=3059160 RepID=A0ABP1CUX6_9APHY
MENLLPPIIDIEMHNGDVPPFNWPDRDVPDDIIFLTFIALTNMRDAKHSLLSASQVCRRWRLIASYSARLWSKVDLSDLKIASQYVVRARDAPITIMLRRDKVADVPQGLPTFLSTYLNFAQVVEIVLELPYSVMAQVLPFLNCPLPALKTLTLALTGGSDEENEAEPYALEARLGMCSNLRTLELTRIIVRSLSCDTQVRAIRWVDQFYGWADNMLTMDQFLEVLRKCPFLDTLYLQDAGPWLDIEDPEYPQLPPINLPNVRMVELRLGPGHMKYLLSYIVIPEEAKVTCYTCLGDEEDFEYMLPKDMSNIRMTQCADTAVFTNYEEETTLYLRLYSQRGASQGSTAPVGRFDLNLACGTEDEDAIPEYLHPKAISTITLIPSVFPGIRDITVRCDLVEIGASQWQSILETFGNVTTIRLTNIRKGFESESADRPYLFEALLSSSGRGYICPKLREIELYDLRITDEFIHVASQALLQRQKMGLQLRWLLFYVREAEWDIAQKFLQSTVQDFITRPSVPAEEEQWWGQRDVESRGLQ